MKAALDNLASLSAEPAGKTLPEGTTFDLQVSALIGETHALHFELSRLDDNRDLTRLLPGDLVKLSGLDRKLWVQSPAEWCKPD
jgi:hypothetical protein